ALLLYQGGDQRTRSSDDELGTVQNHLFGSRAIEEVVVEFAAISAERIEIAGFLAEVEIAAISVVQKNAICSAPSHGHEKGNRFIERIGGLLPAIGVRIPHAERLIAVIEWATLVSQAEVMFVLGHGLPNTECVVVQGDRVAG